jgi:alpha-N-arabinofuranosidase
MYEFDLDNLKLIGEEKILVNGGTDISKKPVWIEAPHIFQKDGYYYLTAAEGGTSDNHSQVIFRSNEVDGPYVPYENNPILTQRHLNPKREFPITCTGHSDFVQTATGEWWAVFLGCRPYRPFEEGYYNTGRETFLAPVRWINGWPVINPDIEEVQYYYLYPIQRSKEAADIPYGGNFQIRDDFDKGRLNPNWAFLRTPRDKWYDLTRRPGFLSMQLRPESCAGNMNPSFLGRRQQHAHG